MKTFSDLDFHPIHPDFNPSILNHFILFSGRDRFRKGKSKNGKEYEGFGE